jgi:hypothetical protein
MKPKALLRLLFVASMVLMIFVAALIIAPKWRQMEFMRQSEPIHEALKAYHLKHCGFPDSLDQIGIPSREEGPIYYQREGSSYLLWFGTRLGESRTYCSSEGYWR